MLYEFCAMHPKLVTILARALGMLILLTGTICVLAQNNSGSRDESSLYHIRPGESPPPPPDNSGQWELHEGNFVHPDGTYSVWWMRKQPQQQIETPVQFPPQVNPQLLINQSRPVTPVAPAPVPKPAAPYHPPSRLSEFLSIESAPPSKPLPKKVEIEQSIDQLLAENLENVIDALLRDANQSGQEPLDNLPPPKKPGEAGEWRNKGGLRITASVNDFLFINASVLACVCNSKGEASFTGDHLKIYNGGKRPFYFSSKVGGQAANMIVQPGETYIQLIGVYRTAAESRDKSLEVDMEATYWYPAP